MNIESLQKELNNKQPREILSVIYPKVKNITLSFSGAEDVVLIDMACKLGLEPNVFTLDTGRLHPETYRFIQTVMEHYNIKISILTPEHKALQKLTDEKGLFSFYQDGHKDCCGIRKVEPLKRHLSTHSAWITGQRRDQSKSTRDSLEIVELDASFTGVEDELLKFNPLCHWSSEQVWAYIRALDVPFNLLHNQGYPSIGCEPCTRPVLPHQEAREGRWWWESENNKECGLHSGLSKPDN